MGFYSIFSSDGKWLGTHSLFVYAQEQIESEDLKNVDVKYFSNPRFSEHSLHYVEYNAKKMGQEIYRNERAIDYEIAHESETYVERYTADEKKWHEYHNLGLSALTAMLLAKRFSA